MYRESKYIKYMYYKSFTNDYKGIKLSEVTLDFIIVPSPTSTCKTGLKNGSEPNGLSGNYKVLYIRISSKTMHEMRYNESSFLLMQCTCVYIYTIHFLNFQSCCRYKYAYMYIDQYVNAMKILLNALYATCNPVPEIMRKYTKIRITQNIIKI